MATLVYGKPVADKILENVQKKLKLTNAVKEVRFYQVGDDPASNIYVRNKFRTCANVGLSPVLTKFSKNSRALQVKKEIAKTTYPSMVQLPLNFSHGAFSEKDILEHVKYDIDGLSTINGGYLYDMDFEKSIVPCTAQGVMDILEFYDYDVTGKTVLIAGKSKLVGRPLIMLLLARGATVISINSKTPIEKTKALLAQSDVLISAIGQAKFFNRELVPDTIEFIVDVGINKNEETGKLLGDVDPELYSTLPDNVKITPVPKGVGVVTVANVARNALRLINQREGYKE